MKRVLAIAVLLVGAVLVAPSSVASADGPGKPITLEVQGFAHGARAQLQYVSKQVDDRDTGGKVLARHVTLTVLLHVDVLHDSVVSARHPDFKSAEEHTRTIKAGKEALKFVFTGRFPLLDQYRHLWRPGKTNKLKQFEIGVDRVLDDEPPPPAALTDNMADGPPSKKSPIEPDPPDEPAFKLMSARRAVQIYLKHHNATKDQKLSQRDRDSLTKTTLRVQSLVGFLVQGTRKAGKDTIEIDVANDILDPKTGKFTGLRSGDARTFYATRGNKPRPWNARLTARVPWAVAYDLREGDLVRITWRFTLEDGRLSDILLSD